MPATRLASLASLLALVGCGTKGGIAADTGGEEAAPSFADRDGDTILDLHEGGEEDDADGDGVPNYMDTDSDADGVPDILEAGDADLETLPRDADMDGVPDFLDTDADGNCLVDGTEGPANQDPLDDLDGDGLADAFDLDDDNDGMSDQDEGDPFGCGPFDFDNDGDQDRVDLDSDNDGILDAYEAGPDGAVDTDGDGIIDSRDLDSDADGLPDVEERNPDGSGTSVDTDGDGLPDQQDPDSDGDGITDGLEWTNYETDFRQADTDGDGVPDGGEVYIDTDPLDPDSTVDGIYLELDPRAFEELELQVALTIQRADVAFLLDTTMSMTDEAASLRLAFSDITERLALTVPDTAFGFATFEDYVLASTGTDSTGALPFRMQQQITTSTSLMESALSYVEHHAGGIGGDYPESTIEALYQALTGAGYDQNCNTIFDERQDVRPFDADPEDPFGGIGGEHNDESTPGGGELGGMGFREHALPVIIYAADDLLKDMDDADSYAMAYGCPQDAGMTDVFAAAQELGAYLIGICSPGQGYCRPQMEQIAEGTGTMGDLDGDGLADDPLVFDWQTGSDDTTELLAGAVEQLINALEYEELALEVDDPEGFVVDIEPERFDVTGLDADVQAVTFTLELLGVLTPDEGDQYRTVTISAIGDEILWVDQVTVLIRVLQP